MKKIQSPILFLIFCALSLFVIPAPSSASTNAQPWGEQEAERDAQEEITFAERSAQEEMGSSIYGRILSIDQNARILSLLPTDQVENKEEEDDDDVTSQDYHFNSNTPLTGIDSTSELSAGDYVTLEYFTFRDKNKITEIVFDKHEKGKDEAVKANEYAPADLVG